RSPARRPAGRGGSVHCGGQPRLRARPLQHGWYAGRHLRRRGPGRHRLRPRLRRLRPEQLRASHRRSPRCRCRLRPGPADRRQARRGGGLVVAGAAGRDFALARYEGDFATLGLTTAGTGSGTVTSDPAGLDCSASCSARFPFGATVNLTAIPAPGSVFAGWSGDPDCADGPVTLNADEACTATFEVLVALTVTREGTGSGTVTSDPAGIECGETCTQ